MAIKWQDKDPDDIVDYSIDWTSILEGYTISSVVWKIVDENDVLQTWSKGQTINGLQYVSSSNSNTVSTLYLGLGTAFKTYYITCRMTTSISTVFELEARLRVVEKN